jgi:hypothetical protein
MQQMSETETKTKVHLISEPGKNKVGTERYWLLRASAEKAAQAFKQGFYLEAITLTESLLATRLEVGVHGLGLPKGALPSIPAE